MACADLTRNQRIVGLGVVTFEGNTSRATASSIQRFGTEKYWFVLIARSKAKY